MDVPALIILQAHKNQGSNILCLFTVFHLPFELEDLEAMVYYLNLLLLKFQFGVYPVCLLFKSSLAQISVWCLPSVKDNRTS